MNEADCNELNLDQQLYFKLYSASQLIASTHLPLLSQLSVSYPQYLVLLVLWELSDRDALPVNLCELEQEMRLDSATLTPLLKQLQEAGSISRKRCRNDERDMKVDITQQGLALKQIAEEWRHTRIDEETLPFALMARLHHDISDFVDWVAQEKHVVLS